VLSGCSWHCQRAPLYNDALTLPPHADQSACVRCVRAGPREAFVPGVNITLGQPFDRGAVCNAKR